MQRAEVGPRSQRRRVFFVGATGQAKICQIMLARDGYIVPLVFDSCTTVTKPFDCELFHDPALLEARAKSCGSFLVCIGGAGGEARSNYSNRLMNAGVAPISVVHPTAYIGDTVKVGRGLQAMPGVVVNELVTIGDWVILNSNSTIDHECRIGSGVHIMGGASLAGLIEIGDFASIGTNATILPRIKIGRGAFVGAGAVVTKDVPAGAVVVGVPARPV